MQESTSTQGKMNQIFLMALGEQPFARADYFRIKQEESGFGVVVFFQFMCESAKHYIELLGSEGGYPMFSLTNGKLLGHLYNFHVMEIFRAVTKGLNIDPPHTTQNEVKQANEPIRPSTDSKKESKLSLSEDEVRIFKAVKNKQSDIKISKSLTFNGGLRKSDRNIRSMVLDVKDRVEQVYDIEFSDRYRHEVAAFLYEKGLLILT